MQLLAIIKAIYTNLSYTAVASAAAAAAAACPAAGFAVAAAAERRSRSATQQRPGGNLQPRSLPGLNAGPGQKKDNPVRNVNIKLPAMIPSQKPVQLRQKDKLVLLPRSASNSDAGEAATAAATSQENAAAAAARAALEQAAAAMAEGDAVLDMSSMGQPAHLFEDLAQEVSRVNPRAELNPCHCSLQSPELLSSQEAVLCQTPAAPDPAASIYDDQSVVDAACCCDASDAAEVCTLGAAHGNTWRSVLWCITVCCICMKRMHICAAAVCSHMPMAAVLFTFQLQHNNTIS
jgi:hypothetical protein